MNGKEKDELHKILKVTYLSVQKFSSTLATIEPEGIPEKIRALLEYLSKKEKECLVAEKQRKEEQQRKKQQNTHRMTIDLVKFLGERGFTRTADSIRKYYSIDDLVSTDKYIETKKTVKHAIVQNSLENISSKPKSVRTALISREIASLCESPRKTERGKAYTLIKQYKEDVPVQLLPLLVLPPDSSLFQRISKEFKKIKMQTVLENCLKELFSDFISSSFYQRTSLGVSGFITPACREREKEESQCPGCSRDISRLAANAPRSIRVISRPMCSIMKRVIPTSNTTYVSRTGEVFGENGLFLLGSSESVKRCYFV